MMRSALFSQLRPSPRCRGFRQPRSSLNIRAFSRSTFYLFYGKSEPGEEMIAFPIQQILESVRTRAITSQNAVQYMASLAKNRSEHKRAMVCMYLWKHSFEAARRSSDSTVAIVDFLSQLSSQSQEDYDDWPDGSVPSPIMIEGDFGHKERLWHDMPGMWSELDNLRTDGRPTDVGSDRKAGIDRLLKDRHFISALFLSTSPVFKQLLGELFLPFTRVTEWPPARPRAREDWDIWIPAIVVQMETAGAALKDEVLGTGPGYGNWPTLGWWLRWQRRLSAMAADETMDAELRVMLQQAHDMMTIDRHLTNHWWRQWQHTLIRIAADEQEDKDERVTAKRTNDILAAENARMRR